MLLNNVNGFQGTLLRIIDVLLVVWVEAGEWTVPRTNLGEELGIGEREPLQYGGVILLGLTEESRLLVLRSNCKLLVSYSIAGQ